MILKVDGNQRKNSLFIFPFHSLHFPQVGDGGFDILEIGDLKLDRRLLAWLTQEPKALQGLASGHNLVTQQATKGMLGLQSGKKQQQQQQQT